MFAVAQIPSLPSDFLQQIFPSKTPAPNPALNLACVLWNVPSEKQAELENLCHWLVCCKNLWPAAMHAHFNAEPFSLDAFDQTLRVDPLCVEKVVYGTLEKNAFDLLEDINRYVLASGDSHWHALQIQDYPAASIDPAGVPRNWPRECLELAMRTMNMRGADLFLGNLSQLTLPDVDLSLADLRYACLDGTELPRANLGLAKVEHATFRSTRLSGANVTGLTFSTGKKNLEKVILDGAILNDIGLDVGPHALRQGLLPPPLDKLVRAHLNAMVEQDFASRAARYLPRILPHIEMSPAFCRECLGLSMPEDYPVVLQAIMRHAVARYMAPTSDIMSMNDITSIYDAIAAYVERQFFESIDKKNDEQDEGKVKQDHDKKMQRIFGEICQNNLDYLKCITPISWTHENLLCDRMISTGACLQLGDDEKRECLKTIAVTLLNTAEKTPPGFDAIRRALKHLSLSNLIQAFRTLMHDMTPEHCNRLIQRDLDWAVTRADLPESARESAPDAGAVDENASGTASIPEENPRKLIDLLSERLHPDMRPHFHTLLENVWDEPEQIVYEGDWDELGSYTADDKDDLSAGIGGQACADTDARASDEATATIQAQAERPMWQAALCSSLLVLPAQYFLNY